MTSVRVLIAALATLSVACSLPCRAVAQDDPEPTSDDRVEAPPQPSQPPPTPARGAEGPPADAPLAVPVAPVEDRLAGLTRYTGQRLQVRVERHLEGGGYTAVTGYYSWPWVPFVGVGTTYVVTEPVIEYKTWSVYQGSARLTVPTYLDVVGRTDDAARLRRRIQHRRVGSGVLLGAAAGGLIAAVGGGFAYMNARDGYERAGSSAMALAGGLTALMSVSGSFGLASDARRLRWSFPGSFDGGIQDEVRAHNDRLRQDLGLRASDVRPLDEGPRR